MTEAIRASFIAQARACEALGSPLTGRVLRKLAVILRAGRGFDDRVLGWTGLPDASHDALALRVAAGLHALVLAGRDEGLAAAYAAGTVTEAVLDGVLERHGADLAPWLDSPPQTNEPRRAAAIIAAAHWMAGRLGQVGQRVVLSELGASAGLNLIWDKMALHIGSEVWGPEEAAVTLRPEWQGNPPPRGLGPKVIARAGVDLRPIDPVQDGLRLRAYIWADQADRLARGDALAPLVPPGAVQAGDAIDWLAGRLASPPEGAVHLVYHTIAWQYFPPEAQARGLALLQAAGGQARADRPLAHLAMEADGGKGAGLRLTLWPGGETHLLARVDFHGRWVEWLV